MPPDQVIVELTDQCITDMPVATDGHQSRVVGCVDHEDDIANEA